MRFGQILLDILAWIKARLYQQKTSKQNPYEVLTRRRSPYGSLCLVERDTPRAIRTFVFMPFRGNGDDPEPQDVHIYLDTLTALEKAKDASQRAKLNHVNGKATHKITVVLADHWVSADGTYNADVLHEGFYDLQGRSSYEHRQAIATIDNLVTLLLHQRHDDIDWAFEIDASRKLHVPDSSGSMLLELLVVIVISGVLGAAIAIPVALNAINRAKETEGQQLIANPERTLTEEKGQ